MSRINSCSNGPCCENHDAYVYRAIISLRLVLLQLIFCNEFESLYPAMGDEQEEGKVFFIHPIDDENLLHNMEQIHEIMKACRIK